jgi:peroxiredoxin
MGTNARVRQVQRKRKQRIRIGLAATGAVIAAVVIGITLMSTSDSGSAQTGKISSTSSSVGKSFPEFTLTDVKGKTVSKSSFNGKKTVVWFTDSTCVPCQLGAVKVRQLDDQLGGDAFNVLAVFANSREPASALTSWQGSYARPDWVVASDANSALSNDVQLRYLDTRFILDENGTIVDVTSSQVDDGYVKRLRKTVEG